MRLEEYAGLPISWERASAIFDHPAPPSTVCEHQFDGADDQLEKLARAPYEDIDFSDLWYYHHDLAYVDLQPELFAYLFPVCLMDWHDTLMKNTACSHGDSEFHYGIFHGKVFEKMLTPRQLEAVTMFFRDSFLERLNLEQSFAAVAQDPFGIWVGTYVWMLRFNSLGFIVPNIGSIWDAWWRLETHGRSIAALQYISDLMYFPGENRCSRNGQEGRAVHRTSGCIWHWAMTR